MAKMLVNWEHAIERLLERVRLEDRERVQKRIDAMIGLEAPRDATGHYEWHIDVNSSTGETIARIICRGIALRTVYGPEMSSASGAKGLPAPKSTSHRYRLNKAGQFERA